MLESKVPVIRDTLRSEIEETATELQQKRGHLDRLVMAYGTLGDVSDLPADLIGSTAGGKFTIVGEKRRRGRPRGSKTRQRGPGRPKGSKNKSR